VTPLDVLEVAANLFTALAIVLAGRNNVHTWWTGIVGTGLFAVLFAYNRLYADVVLQAFFVVTGIIGWWRWLHGGNAHDELPVTHASLSSILWTIPVGLLATAGYGALLHFYTKAFSPFVDSAVLVFSVIGQVMMMQRRVENWGFWLLVNTIAVPLYFSRGLYLTSLLYAGFWVNAVVSWITWHRLAAAPAVAAVSSSVPLESQHT
jgi:nicotinamide mononucleotide transporter